MKLSTKSKIQILLNKGTRWENGPLRFFALPASVNGGALGLLTSRKAYPLAVDRNRLKRLLRHGWRQANASPQWKFLVFIKSGIDVQNANQAKMNGWLYGGLAKRGLGTPHKEALVGQ